MDLVRSGYLRWINSIAAAPGQECHGWTTYVAACSGWTMRANTYATNTIFGPPRIAEGPLSKDEGTTRDRANFQAHPNAESRN